MSSNSDDDINSCTSSPESNAEQDEEKGEVIAAAEEFAVTWLRLGLAAVLIASTIGVSCGIYFYVSNAETEEFENAFADNSAKVVEQFQGIAERRMGAIAAFSTSVTAHTMATNAEWPFVTIPQYEAQASHFISLSDAVSISLNVIVEPEDRRKWENEFVPRTALSWIDESMTFANVSNTESGGRPGGPPPAQEVYEGKPTVGRGGITKEIYTRTTTPLGTRGPLIAANETNLVWWQTSPFKSGFAQAFINLNVRYDRTFEPQGRLLEVLEKKKAALGLISNNGGFGSNEDRPITGFYYPVLTSYDESARLVASFVTLLHWDTFFADILPPNADGLITVLKNTCNQSFTYEINGPDAVFLGEGDKHDPKYNGMMAEVDFTALINQSILDGTYKGLPIDEEGCQYSIQVFASAEMESRYVSNNPWFYTMAAAMIFLFTSLVFLLYDCYVQRRQRLTLNEAQKSGAIVSSLFPTDYKKELMEEQGEELQRKGNGKAMRVFDSSNKNLTNLRNETIYEDGGFADKKKLANVYPDCTVFFADLAGFTKWSSTRTPDDVFTLLQGIFGSFDRVAQRRKVFKVETIGDCYLAVTGLPNAQENHALIMAKFAQDCLLKLHECTIGLSDTLGKDTTELSLRVGLHSGPITGGVLRGERSRFQVFGDTINTGSRMESTGERNRIQVSANTAELLRDKHGKGHWLQARAEQVEAKGKGKMQTYWLVPDRSGSVYTSAYTSTSGSAVSEDGFSRDEVDGVNDGLDGFLCDELDGGNDGQDGGNDGHDGSGNDEHDGSNTEGMFSI